MARIIILLPVFCQFLFDLLDTPDRNRIRDELAPLLGIITFRPISYRLNVSSAIYLSSFLFSSLSYYSAGC